MSINPVEIPTGAVRFNTDSSKMEVYIGDTWMEVSVSSPNLGDTQSVAGGRALFLGGRTPSITDTIDYVTISSIGDAIDFGNLTTTRRSMAGMADSTRGLSAGGINNSSGNIVNDIDFFTIASTGINAQDFGNLTVTRAWLAGVNNATRGIAGGAWDPSRSNVMDYVTIQSTGDAVDFGDLTVAAQRDGSFSSPTRGFWVGGASGSGPAYDATTTGTVINFVTTSSLGNAQDFGDLLNGTFGKTGAANSIRGIAGSGYGSPASIFALEFITMATLGNATNFGTLTQASNYYGAATSNSTRAIFGGGDSNTDVIQYVEIATQGDSVDFGDLTASRTHLKGVSNANGGL